MRSAVLLACIQQTGQLRCCIAWVCMEHSGSVLLVCYAGRRPGLPGLCVQCIVLRRSGATLLYMCRGVLCSSADMSCLGNMVALVILQLQARVFCMLGRSGDGVREQGLLQLLCRWVGNHQCHWYAGNWCM